VALFHSDIQLARPARESPQRWFTSCEDPPERPLRGVLLHCVYRAGWAWPLRWKACENKAWLKNWKNYH
jgi:hypothetical protein